MLFRSEALALAESGRLGGLSERGAPSQFKIDLLNDIPEDEEISIFKNGDFWDLCAGPHVGRTGNCKAYKVMSVASALYKGDNTRPQLQRVYGTCFTSDIQLLDKMAISIIIAWKPTVVLASGPPIYLPRLREDERRDAWQNAKDLAREVETLILDHHLLRSEEGFRWLKRLNEVSDNEVLSAAEFMGTKPRLLEARRKKLYAKMPVPPGWHEAYANGEGGLEEYVKFEG